MTAAASLSNIRISWCDATLKQRITVGLIGLVLASAASLTASPLLASAQTTTPTPAPAAKACEGYTIGSDDWNTNDCEKILGQEASQALRASTLGKIIQRFCLVLAILAFIWAVVQALFKQRQGEQGSRVIAKLMTPFLLGALLFNIWWTADALGWAAGIVVSILRSIAGLFDF